VLHVSIFSFLPLFSQVIEAGANAIVAGSAVFKAPSYKDGEYHNIPEKTGSLWTLGILRWSRPGPMKCR